MIARRYTADDRRRRVDMIVRRCRTLTAVRVVHYLARLEQMHDRITPSRAGIARAIGRCERSVSRAIGELEAVGAVDVWRDRPHGRKDGTWTRRRTNMYRLKWPPKSANAQVAQRGHAMPIYAIPKALEPTGGAPDAAPTPDVDAPTLFPIDETDPPDEPPAPPPWIAAGMSPRDWVRRCRT